MVFSYNWTISIKNLIEWKKTLILFIFWPYCWFPKLVQILVSCYWTTSIKQMPAHIKFDFWVNMLTLSFNFITLYMSTTFGAKPGYMIPLPISLSRSLIPTLWKRVGSDERIHEVGATFFGFTTGRDRLPIYRKQVILPRIDRVFWMATELVGGIGIGVSGLGWQDVLLRPKGWWSRGLWELRR